MGFRACGDTATLTGWHGHVGSQLDVPPITAPAQLCPECMRERGPGLRAAAVAGSRFQPARVPGALGDLDSLVPTREGTAGSALGKDVLPGSWHHHLASVIRGADRAPGGFPLGAMGTRRGGVTSLAQDTRVQMQRAGLLSWGVALCSQGTVAGEEPESPGGGSPAARSPANTETHSLPTHRNSPFRLASNQNWASSTLVHGGREPSVTFMLVSGGRQGRGASRVQVPWRKMELGGRPLTGGRGGPAFASACGDHEDAAVSIAAPGRT